MLQSARDCACALVALVVLRAERLEHEVIRNEPERRSEAVRNKRHLQILSPVAS
jgi:hypothetical protein